MGGFDSGGSQPQVPPMATPSGGGSSSAAASPAEPTLADALSAIRKRALPEKTNPSAKMAKGTASSGGGPSSVASAAQASPRSPAPQSDGELQRSAPISASAGSTQARVKRPASRIS